jgi:Flp pilus assembly protein TadG
MLERIRTRLAIQGKPLFQVATVRRLVRHEDGSTAVEFGLLGIPFFGLMFAIIETALVFFAGQTLETATADASRLIMTGQAQTQSFDKQKFKDAVCSRIYGLFNCQAGLKLDVRKAASFSGADMKKPLNVKKELVDGNFTFDAGKAGDIIVVRVMYEWPIYVAFLSDMANGKRLLMATAAFRNEPYQ